jgi:hypothetical protein
MYKDKLGKDYFVIGSEDHRSRVQMLTDEGKDYKYIKPFHMIIELNPTPHGSDSEMETGTDTYLSVPEYRTNE